LFPHTECAVLYNEVVQFLETYVEKQGSKEEKEEYDQMKLLDF